MRALPLALLIGCAPAVSDGGDEHAEGSGPAATRSTTIPGAATETSGIGGSPPVAGSITADENSSGTSERRVFVDSQVPGE